MILWALLAVVVVASAKPLDFFEAPDYDDFELDGDDLFFLHGSPHILHGPPPPHHGAVVHAGPPPQVIHRQPPPAVHVRHSAPPPPPPPPRRPPPPRPAPRRPPPPPRRPPPPPQTKSVLAPVRSYHGPQKVDQFHNRDDGGRVSFGFAHQGQVKSEFKDPQGNVHGYFSYDQPSAKPTVVLYKAGPNGFHASSNKAPSIVHETPEVVAAREQHHRLYNEVVRQRGLDKTAFPQSGQYNPSGFDDGQYRQTGHDDGQYRHH